MECRGQASACCGSPEMMSFGVRSRKPTFSQRAFADSPGFNRIRPLYRNQILSFLFSNTFDMTGREPFSVIKFVLYD